MKKKRKASPKQKPKVRAKRRVAKPPSPEILSLMQKVKLQLENLKKPVVLPILVPSPPELTAADYRKMDPLADTMMGGLFAGRVVNDFHRDFPKTVSLLDWIKQDLGKWPFKFFQKSS